MERGPKNADHLQGTLDLLILKTLERGSNHGFGVALDIQETSEGLLRVEEGSLYPALHRMERDGVIAGEWRLTDKGRRARFYTLTAVGKRRLAEVESNWTTVALGVRRVLRSA
ncbi:MAG TPA: PadR family transcriptional regulator [Bryobacteraceae bacterium]|nr:PadR family transcriptional regulator [Bryobacteraceae bacterium]